MVSNASYHDIIQHYGGISCYEGALSPSGVRVVGAVQQGIVQVQHQRQFLAVEQPSRLVHVHHSAACNT